MITRAQHQGHRHRGAADDPRLRGPRDDRLADVLHAPARRDVPPRREGRVGRRTTRRIASWPGSRAARKSTATRCSTRSAGARTRTCSTSPRRASTPTRAARSPSTSSSRPRCRTSTPPATSSVSRRSPRPPWSRGAWRAVTCSARTARAAASVPYGIYTIPEISMVGKTEQELTAAKVPYEIGVSKFEELAKGQMLGVDAGLLKLLFDREHAQAPRRPHLRRARDRDHPHRPGRARLRRHDRLLPRHRLQLPDHGRSLQGGRPRRSEPSITTARLLTRRKATGRSWRE